MVYNCVHITAHDNIILLLKPGLRYNIISTAAAAAVIRLRALHTMEFKFIDSSEIPIYNTVGVGSHYRGVSLHILLLCCYYRGLCRCGRTIPFEWSVVRELQRETKKIITIKPTLISGI